MKRLMTLSRFYMRHTRHVRCSATHPSNSAKGGAANLVMAQKVGQPADVSEIKSLGHPPLCVNPALGLCPEGYRASATEPWPPPRS